MRYAYVTSILQKYAKKPLYTSQWIGTLNSLIITSMLFLEMWIIKEKANKTESDF